jgi:hypothetical protein
MDTQIRDYIPLLKAAIAEARADGLFAAVNDLERSAFAAFTTSSEMLQEHGLAIKRFLRATHGLASDSVESKLKACLIETQLASTGWRKLIACLRRRSALS